MDLTERLRAFIEDLPVMHRVVMGASIVGLLLVAFLFFQWVSTPTYTVLFSGMDEREVAAAIDELESMGVPYRLESGGTTIMVPKPEMSRTRAQLAGVGIAGSAAPAGYELLDNESLTISDFKQRVDFQRAVEGELAHTLSAMDAVDSAQVHLVIPEDDLFREAETGASASVLVDPARQLRVNEVETIVFVVSSAVDGLAPEDVTVADTDGNVLNAPGDAAGVASVTDRNMRMTREFEAGLTADITRLLATAIGEPNRASVAVKAVLDFDEQEIETESWDPDSQVAVREQTIDEEFQGTGSPPGGTVGVDGGPIETAADSETTYSRNEQVTEYGVDRVVNRTKAAPGDIEKLSIAIVMDDGSVSGISVPSSDAVQTLVAAAVGLDTTRGDTLAVEQVAMPETIGEEAPAADALGGILDLVPQVIGVLVLILIAVYFLLAARRSSDKEEELVKWLPAGRAPQIGGGEGQRTAEARVREPAAVGAGAAGAVGPGAPQEQDLSQIEASPDSVTQMVERQPNEIASLLRSWLAEEGGEG